METSETIGAIAAAMAKAQGDMKAAAKGSDNPFFKSKYADLNSCFEACREALAKNEIAIFQSPTVDENWQVNVTTLLAHKSGEWIRDTLPMPVVKKDPQGVGSSISYARRYSLTAMVGLAQADDDAESALDRSGKADAPPAPKARKKPEKVPAERMKAIQQMFVDAPDMEAAGAVWQSLTEDERKHPDIQAMKESAKQRMAA